MSVSTFNQPNFTSDDPSSYKGKIDASIAVLAGIAAQFAPHQQSTANMSILVDAGSFLNGTTLTTNTQQETANITAPASNPRIDRVVVDTTTGIISVVTGVEAGSPSAPAIPSGNCPVAQITLQTTSNQILNSMIVDERNFKQFTATQSTYAATLNGYTANVVSGGNAVNIWQGTDIVQMTGTGNTTGFANAPSIGSQCKIITTDACNFVAGANMLISGIPTGNTVTMAANATINVLAIAVNQFQLSYELSGSCNLTWNGFNTTPSGIAYYSVRNGVVTINIPPVIAASNANTFSISGLPDPIVPFNPIGGTAYPMTALPYGYDNSAYAYDCHAVISSSSITMAKSGFSTGWTSSGNKGNSGLSFSYNLRT